LAPPVTEGTIDEVVELAWRVPEAVAAPVAEALDETLESMTVVVPTAEVEEVVEDPVIDAPDVVVPSLGEAIWKGKEYWKVAESESREILNP